MSKKNLALGIMIGATTAPSITQTFQSVEHQINSLGKNMRDLNKRHNAAKAVTETREKLAALQRRQEKYNLTSGNTVRAIGMLEKKLSQAENKMRKLGMSTKRAAIEEQKLNQQLKATSANLTRLNAIRRNSQRSSELRGRVAGAIGVGFSLALPLKQSVEFESKIADVNKVLGGLETKQLKEIQREILTLSKTSPIAAQGVGDIYVAGGKAGFAREQLRGFAMDAIKMSVAFDMSAEESGTILSKWRKSIGMTRRESQLLADQTNHIANLMPATAGEISNVIIRVGALGKTAGLSNGEMAALSGSMIAAAPNMEMAGTAAKALVSALSRGTSATARQSRAFKTLGFDAVQLSQHMQEDAQGAIKSVLQTINELEEYEQAAVLTDLFGKESVGTIAAVAKNTGNLDKALASLKLQQSELISVDKEYATRTKTRANQVEVFKNKVVALGISIGNILLPSLSLMVSIGGKVAGFIEGLINRFPLLSSFVITSAAALGVFYIGSLAVGVVATTVSQGWLMMTGALKFLTLTSLKANAALIWTKTTMIAGTIATKAITAAQWLWNVALTANPIGLIIVGVGALIGGLAYLYHKSETVRAALGILWWAVKKLLSPFSFLKDIIVAVGSAAWNVFSGIFSYLKPVGSAIYSFIVAPFNMAKGVLGWVSDKIIGLAKKLGVLKDDSSNIKVGIKGVGDLTSDDLIPDNNTKSHEQLVSGAVRSSSNNVSVQNSHSISIETHPGMSPEEIAKAVSEQLDMRDRDQAARLRGNLHDGGF